jgi:hypothetical protein
MQLKYLLNGKKETQIPAYIILKITEYTNIIYTCRVIGSDLIFDYSSRKRIVSQIVVHFDWVANVLIIGGFNLQQTFV